MVTYSSKFFGCPFFGQAHVRWTVWGHDKKKSESNWKPFGPGFGGPWSSAGVDVLALAMDTGMDIAIPHVVRSCFLDVFLKPHMPHVPLSKLWGMSLFGRFFDLQSTGRRPHVADQRVRRKLARVDPYGVFHKWRIPKMVGFNIFN